MATEKPRFSITVSDDVYQQINDYQHEHRLPTQTKAVLAFIEKGLEVIQNEKKPPTKIIEVEEISIESQCGKHATKDEMEHLIKKYRLLGPNWKDAVDGILDIGYREYEEKQVAQKAAIEKQRERMEAAGEITPEVVFICPGFSSPMSAGTGQQAVEEYPENYRLTKEPPRGTSYIAPVSGSSMEPTYHDGEKLFIHSCTEIRRGQIGVFFMDGQQWVKELGDGVLISHNSGYDPRPMTDDVRCQGLVLGVCDESYFE